MHIASNLSVSNSAVSTADPLRVLYVMCGFPVLSETFISNEIRAMRALGHTVVPLTMTPHMGACQPDDEPFRDEVLHLKVLPTLPALARAAMHPARLASALRFARSQQGIPVRSLMRAAAQVALLAQREGCTHIHAHFAHSAAATAIAAAKLAGVTCSFIGHGYDIYGSPADVPAKLRAVDVALATCIDMANHFREWAPEANIRTMSCGIDPSRFTPAAGTAHNGKLLAIGRMVEQKGYEVLIEAVASLPVADRAVIDVVGGGERAAALGQLAIERGVSDWVRFLGPQPQSWIAANGPDYLGFVAPYVICRNGDRDTGPLVLKEAMCMGLPIVASDVMGMKETVDSVNGRSVPQGNVAALADALAWINGLTESERRALGLAGRERALQHHTLRGQAESLSAAIRSVRR